MNGSGFFFYNFSGTTVDLYHKLTSWLNAWISCYAVSSCKSNNKTFARYMFDTKMHCLE